MIRGHLLNHDLGGFGVEENLYPITSGANKKHTNNVENHVGDELNNASIAGNGAGVYYSVKVNPIQNTSHSLMNNTIFNKLNPVNVFDRDTILHLRIPFSFFLLPVLLKTR